jgi:hypothetical protein
VADAEGRRRRDDYIGGMTWMQSCRLVSIWHSIA